MLSSCNQQVFLTEIARKYLRGDIITKGKIEFIADCAVLEEFEEDAKEIADSLEIIGNIYENPELLEVTHE